MDEASITAQDQEVSLNHNRRKLVCFAAGEQHRGPLAFDSCSLAAVKAEPPLFCLLLRVENAREVAHD